MNEHITVETRKKNPDYVLIHNKKKTGSVTRRGKKEVHSLYIRSP